MFPPHALGESGTLSLSLAFFFFWPSRTVQVSPFLPEVTFKICCA